MAFILGNFSIDEIIEAAAENFEGDLLYTLDQLSEASIEISSESQDITDKNGNVVRTIYTNKTGTFNATNAFLHPQIINATTGSKITNASSSAPIANAPKFQLIGAGSAAVDVDANIDASTLQVIGIFGNGANSNALTAAEGTDQPAFSGLDGTYKYDATNKKISIPAAASDAPVTYLVKYDRSYTEGIKIINEAKTFPDTVKLTLYCSYVDPCDDELKALYVVLPSFQASPETTLSLNRGEQTMAFSGSIQTSYCASEQTLYIIYIPSEKAIKTGVVTTE